MSETTSKLGRKEILTEDLARKICKMIERMPDADIPVTWGNVIAHSKKKFGHGFNRQMLSQKTWDGRKLISETFDVAKEIQKRKQHDTAPKYKTAPRSIMQKRIADLEAKVLALQEELENERARKIDALDAFLNTPRDLRKLITESITLTNKMETVVIVPEVELQTKRLAKQTDGVKVEGKEKK